MVKNSAQDEKQINAVVDKKVKTELGSFKS